MNEYKANAIKNVVLLGHLGSGKTSLAESLALISGRIDKKGSVEKKNSISDFSPEEQAKQSSLSTSLIPLEFKGVKINLLDAPGADELIGDIQHAMSVADAAVLVVDASSGVQVGTEKMWLEIKKQQLPALIFINKMDKENVKFEEVLEEIKNHSSKWIKTKGPEFRQFYWQRGYGAFSVKSQDVETVRQYIANQHDHHRHISFQDEYRRFLQEYQIEYDERYVWD